MPCVYFLIFMWESSNSQILMILQMKSVAGHQISPNFFWPRPNWILEFERQQRQIIELWDACHVALVHRSCFFLLFKGDPSDSVYIEVEHRRLSFLKGTFSQSTNGIRDSRSVTVASRYSISSST